MIIFLCWLLSHCAGLFLDTLRCFLKKQWYKLWNETPLIHLHFFWILKKKVLSRVLVIIGWLIFSDFNRNIDLLVVANAIALNLLATYLDRLSD